jgi:hypothetical protein
MPSEGSTPITRTSNYRASALDQIPVPDPTSTMGIESTGGRYALRAARHARKPSSGMLRPAS